MSMPAPQHVPEEYLVQHHTNVVVASDAFTRREQASEAKYIRDKELERYDLLNSFIHLPETTGVPPRYLG